MERYSTAFYEPHLHDYANFGTWTERGAVDANQRATGVWRNIVNTFEAPESNIDRLGALTDFIDCRTAEGGAPPES